MTDSQPKVPVTPEVFWRPGCPFCSGLRRDLRRRGIEAEWRNIWSDEQARAFVRSANGGDETVPTVRVGTVVLTNPSGAEVAALLPDGHRTPPKPRWWFRLRLRPQGAARH